MEYTPNYNLYVWNEADKKRDTIVGVGNATRTLDTELKAVDTLSKTLETNQNNHLDPTRIAHSASNISLSDGTVLQTEITNLKSSFSNGKVDVRNAITGKGGTVADADGDGIPTFAELVTGVNGLVTGQQVQVVSGTLLTSSANPKQFVLTGLGFTPKAIILTWNDSVTTILSGVITIQDTGNLTVTPYVQTKTGLTGGTTTSTTAFGVAYWYNKSTFETTHSAITSNPITVDGCSFTVGATGTMVSGTWKYIAIG